MPGRNLVPLLLLAVLAVLTAVFAVIGAASAPTSTTIQVQNAADKTFGTPTGANSWIMELGISQTVGGGSGNGSTQLRVIRYIAPTRMVVYDVVGNTLRVAAELRPSAISCVLRSYAAMLQGQGSWKQKGEKYTRTESLADYSARVPSGNGTTCEAVASTAQGQVHEIAVLRSDYLVAAQAQVVVPTRGTQGETLRFLKIGDVLVRTLKP
jgi:hypothetical protein